MLIVSRGAIQEVASAIIAALTSASDHHGRQRVIGTVDPAVLENIALGALTAAAGDVVWPRGKIVERGPEEHLPWLRTIYPRG